MHGLHGRISAWRAVRWLMLHVRRRRIELLLRMGLQMRRRRRHRVRRITGRMLLLLLHVRIVRIGCMRWKRRRLLEVAGRMLLLQMRRLLLKLLVEWIRMHRRRRRL